MRERLLGGLAELVIRRHKAVVVAGAILAIASIAAISRIEVKTKVQDMLPAGNPKVSGLVEMNDRFSGSSSAIILVEGPDKASMAAAAEDLAARLEASPEAGRYTRAISLKADRDFIADWGLLLQEPEDIEKNEGMWRDVNLVNHFRALNDLFEGEYTGDEAEESLESSQEELEAVAALARIETSIENLRLAIGMDDASEAEAAGSELADLSLFGEEYSFSPDGSLLIFTLYPNFPEDDIPSSQALMREIKRLQKEASPSHPGVSFGYAGVIPGNSDEQEALGADMLYPSLVALFLLVVLFLVSFDSVRSILFMLVSLAAGIIFNYGILGAVLGEINMLTSILGALLVGMGIDYGIQIVASYNSFLFEGESRENAIRKTFLRSGGGVLLAALMTAAAFFVFFLSSSKAMVQFGFVAGMGILTCLLSMLLILPSLILWFGREEGASRSRRLPQIGFGFLGRMGMAASRRKNAVRAVSAVLVAAAGCYALITLRFEYDMSKLSSQSMESTIGANKILERFGLNSNSAAISIEGIEEARIMKEKLEDLRGVAMVSTVADYIPSDDEQKERLALLDRLRAEPPNQKPLSFGTEELEALRGEIQRLEYNIIELGDLSVAGLGEGNRIVRQRNRMIREILGAEEGEEGKEVFRTLIEALNSGSSAVSTALARIDAGFGKRMLENAGRMLSADRPIAASDLPESLRREFFDATGRWNLLTVIPSDSVARSSADLIRFGEDLDAVDERITGGLPISIMWMRELVRESVKIGGLLALAVFIMMLASFRKLRYAILAMIPLVAGLVLMFGLVSLFKVQLSAFNLTLTPMVIGIGIAYGSYMIQRYLLEGKRLGESLKYTSKAIFLSALTTMLGFGSLWAVGNFASVSSLGGLIFLGIFSVYIVTMTLLPALLGGRKANS